MWITQFQIFVYILLLSVKILGFVYLKLFSVHRNCIPFRNFTENFKNFCGSNLLFALFDKKNRENAPLWTGRAGQNGSVAKTKCFTDDHIFAFDRTIFNSWYSHWIAICKMFVSSSYSFKASCIHKLFFPSFQIECIYYSEKCFGSNLHENIAIISCCFFYVLCTEMRFASFLFGGFITAIVVHRKGNWQNAPVL